MANVLTHGFGAVLSVIALIVLMGVTLSGGDPRRVLSCAIYGISLIVLYTSSAVAHAVRGPQQRDLFMRIDHAAIYVLIAGTYTPFAMVSLHGPVGTGLLIAVWVIAAAGALFKLRRGIGFQRISLASYIGMGWLVVLVFDPLRKAVPPVVLALLVIGGVLYTAGTYFYVSTARHAHAVWHMFVIAGSISHFIAVYLVVV